MRQVAVVAELQGQGIGKAMVQFSEALARKFRYRRMVLHARETAVPFYEKLGYSRVGDRFEEVTIPHWAMVKSNLLVVWLLTALLLIPAWALRNT